MLAVYHIVVSSRAFINNKQRPMDLVATRRRDAERAQQLFEKECQQLVPLLRCGTDDEKVAAINKMIELHGPWAHKHFYRGHDLFRTHIGWAIPSPVEVSKIAEWIAEYAREADTAERLIKFVDIGAGSGVLELLLHRAGVDAERLIAVDPGFQFDQRYWPLTKDDKYVVAPHDIFFVAWGHPRSALGDKLKDYVARGGQCAIVWGEYMGGCCKPTPEYFQVCYPETWRSIDVCATYRPAGAVDVISFNRVK